MQLFLEVALKPGKLLRFFGFDVQAGFVQRVALSDVDDFIEGQDFQAHVRGARAVRVRRVEPAAGIQGFQFGHGECVGRAVLALGEFARDIGGALQVVVMQRKQHAVLAALQVQFEIIGAEVTRQFVGGRSGFRSIEGGTTMSNDRRLRNARAGGQRGRARLVGGVGLADAEQHAQQQGALGEGDRHGRDPFAEIFEDVPFNN